MLPVAGFLLLNGGLAQFLGPDHITGKYLGKKMNKKNGQAFIDLSVLRLLLKQGLHYLVVTSLIFALLKSSASWFNWAADIVVAP